MRLARVSLAAVAALSVGGALAQEAAETVFFEANDYFRRANEVRVSEPAEARELYRRAARRYRKLVEEMDLRSSQLHYNLANTFLRMDDIGQAILHYRIAQKLDPSDANVRSNLAFARSLRTDKLEAAASRPVLETLLFWHYGLSRSVRLRIFAVAWVAAWGLLLLRRTGRDWVPHEIPIVFLVVGGLLLASLAQDMVSEAHSVSGVVVSAETVARQGDGLSYAPAFEDSLHAGAEFRVLEDRPGWHRVELPDGRRCWLAGRDVELVP